MTENERDEYENELDALYDNWQSAAQKAKQLEFGPGGIMEMKQTVADKEKRIEQLEKLLHEWTGFGCPYCSGDCGSANPPVISCIMQETRDLLMGKKDA